MTDFVFQEQWSSETKAGEGYFYVEGIGLKARFENGKVTYLINTPEGYQEFLYTISIPEHYAVWRDGDTVVVEERYDGKYEFRYSLPEPTKVKMHLIVNSRPTQNQYQFPLQLPEGFYLKVDEDGLKICKNYEWLGGEIVFAIFPHQVGISKLGKTIHVNYTVEDNIPYLNYIPEELDALTPEDYPLDLDPSLILSIGTTKFIGWTRTVYVFPSGKTVTAIVDSSNNLRIYWCNHNEPWNTGPTISDVSSTFSCYGFGVKDNEDLLLFYRKTDNKPYCRACFWSGSNYTLGNEKLVVNTASEVFDAVFDNTTNYWYVCHRYGSYPYHTYMLKTPHGANLSFTACGTSPYGSDTYGTKVGMYARSRLCLINNMLYVIGTNFNTYRICYNRMISNSWGNVVDTGVNTASDTLTGSVIKIPNRIIHVFWKTFDILNFYVIDVNTNLYTKIYSDYTITDKYNERGPVVSFIDNMYYIVIPKQSELIVYTVDSNGNMQVKETTSISEPLYAASCVEDIQNTFSWYGYGNFNYYCLYEFTYSPPQPTKRRRRVGFWWRNRKLVKRLLQD